MNKDLDEIQRLVQSFVDSRQPERAIELLENAIKSDSNFVEAWMLLSSVYRAFGQTDKAIEVCKKSLEHNPNDSIIWVNLGHLYQENNQHEQAFEPLKKALSLDPRNPSAWYSLGMALLAKKEHDRAIEAFQKTSSVNKEKPVIAEIQISRSFSVKFGVRKKLQRDQIPFEIVNSIIHINLFDRVIIQVIDPHQFEGDSLLKKISLLGKKYRLIVSILDFVDFTEKFPEQERLLKQKIKLWGKQNDLQAIPIDNEEELYFILKNIYLHAKKEKKIESD